MPTETKLPFISSVKKSQPYKQDEIIEPVETAIIASTSDTVPPRQSPFTTSLEEHFLKQVIANQIEPDEARRLLADARAATKLSTNSRFKEPQKKVAYGSSNSASKSSLCNDPRLKGIDTAMIELIQSEIVTNLRYTDWSNIVGLESAKAKIQQIAIMPLKRPDLFTGIRVPPKGKILLWFASQNCKDFFR